MQEQATSSLPSSSERSSSSAPQIEVKEGLESDEEIRRVPEFGVEPAGASTSGRETGSAAGQDRAQSSAPSGQRKRGRSPADKEHKRLKRLLRNRVSAQQARERKKAYLNDLEAKVKDLEKKNSELEERLSTLQNENQMLRQVRALFLSSLSIRSFHFQVYGYFGHNNTLYNQGASGVDGEFKFSMRLAERRAYQIGVMLAKYYRRSTL